MSDKPVRLHHHLTYGLTRAAMALLQVLPEGLSYRAVGAVGQVFFVLARGRRRTALEFLARAFPDRDAAELRRIGRRATGNLFKVGLDTVRLIPLLRRGALAERIDLTSVDETFDAWGIRAPYVGVSLHIGSWEVAALSGCQRDPAEVIGQRLPNPLLDRYVRSTREAGGLVTHHRRGGIRPLLEALRGGKVVLMACDQNQRRRGVFVPFFGELASTERSAATLALRLGVPMVLGYALRQGPGFRFRVHAHRAWWPQARGHAETGVAELMAEINRGVEEIVRRHPEQYNWLHRRYKTRPPDEVAAGGDRTA